jgi:salicylate biosynthesis isochorismate synthase/menaquinone-specific isochorismate synthase
MNASTRSAERGLALYGAARAELLVRCERAVRRARRSGTGVIAALTVRVGSEVDPSAVVFASRRPGDPWSCLEEPDRDGSALAVLGAVARLEAAGPRRFATVAAAWRRLAGNAVADAPDGPPGAGLVAVGGFAFSPSGGAAPHWSDFGAADLTVPELALARRGRDVRLTVAVPAEPDDLPDDLVARVERRLAELREGALPLLDPAPAGRFQVASVAPPEHYEAAVARAVERIRAGAFEKIVLAREVAVHAPAPHDAAAVFGVLRAGFSSCYVYCAGRGDAAFVGASPELLVRREGMRASTVALAGSTRRSADPAVDDHLGEQLMRSTKDREEQAIVTRRIGRALRPHSVWVAAPEEPTIVRVANIQHLATPIRAQLTHPISAVELAGLLHPTPAVGGEPHAAAVPLIPALEGLDRGWYAGPVGWTDANEDGEFCVALRCALLRGREARLFAGVGVVRDSDPAAELAETEVKLGALLPVLAG